MVEAQNKSCLRTSVVADLDFEDRLVAVGHGGPDGHIRPCVSQTWPFSFASDKPKL